MKQVFKTRILHTTYRVTLTITRTRVHADVDKLSGPDRIPITEYRALQKGLDAVIRARVEKFNGKALRKI